MRRGLAGGLVAAWLPFAAAELPVEQGPGLDPVDEARVLAADATPQEWLLHGRTYREERFSPLAYVDDTNVDRLGLAWYASFETRRGLEATPIVVDGIMYVTISWSIVYALDARTGAVLWRHDPEVPREWARFACCDVVNRGVAVWGDRVYSATLDGRLIALDRATGELEWSVLTIDRDWPYTITGAPRVVRGKVIIGNGGGELGVRGYVSAYDAETGELVWRFYTVPGNPAEPFEQPELEMAAKTWTGEWWRYGGGGTVWDSMAYDPELDLLYVGVGNGSPWNREIRSPGGGDNLFLSSIVALRPDTGEYVWHYQTTPADTWDYTATQHIILAELVIDGELTPVLMQAPKNGFFYVIDRRTGELLSAENYVPVNWATHVDLETGRPVETATQYQAEPKLTYPSPLGGHNWHPMAYSPLTGLVYIPALDIPYLYESEELFRYDPETWNTGTELAAAYPQPDDDPELMQAIVRRFAKGHLAAWDPVGQREVWRVQYETPWNGGVLATAGNLVFQGTATGHFNAYRADNGEHLWQTPAGTGIIAPPITYALDGEQYVAVMAGWGGNFALMGGPAAERAGVRNVSRLLVYKLDGSVELPGSPGARPRPATLPERYGDEATIERGWRLYHAYCSVCHGANVVSGGVLPDLRHMYPGTHEIFDRIVLEGVYEAAGMPNFEDQLDTADALAIRAYILEEAWKEREAEEQSSLWRRIKRAAYGFIVWVTSLFVRP